MFYIGIDNGVSGSVAILDDRGVVADYFKTPIFPDLGYQKAKTWINRIDTLVLEAKFKAYETTGKVLIERPMVNPGRFKATTSALRALEATLIVLDRGRIPYLYIDSREWQRKLLPEGVSKDELKAASNMVCRRLFPSIVLKKPGDGDSLLIAEYARRKDCRGV